MAVCACEKAGQCNAEFRDSGRQDALCRRASVGLSGRGHGPGAVCAQGA
eukprot:CAMPEP_0204573252 /NCGR_PEP_ID=MMETSP0661-20131031/39912_1 /ASSEMBLY_ACC=CAM_ASM_000606 /TAXON_ID=109239 /ORGANISM="Alexandrium margalefi, Strain AMGDE01CS-322" /LENGTH=48 /DNA_ID= /DNA_START= /DNA_END= /DNA_ORIENTATION=